MTSEFFYILIVGLVKSVTLSDVVAFVCRLDILDRNIFFAGILHTKKLLLQFFCLLH